MNTGGLTSVRPSPVSIASRFGGVAGLHTPAALPAALALFGCESTEPELDRANVVDSLRQYKPAASQNAPPRNTLVSTLSLLLTIESPAQQFSK